MHNHLYRHTDAQYIHKANTCLAGLYLDLPPPLDPLPFPVFPQSLVPQSHLGEIKQDANTPQNR